MSARGAEPGDSAAGDDVGGDGWSAGAGPGHTVRATSVPPAPVPPPNPVSPDPVSPDPVPPDPASGAASGADAPAQPATAGTAPADGGYGPPPAYGTPAAYVQPASPPPGYPQPAYGQPGYGPPAYGQPASPPPGYPLPAYGLPGYPPPQPPVIAPPYGQPGYPPAYGPPGGIRPAASRGPGGIAGQPFPGGAPGMLAAGADRERAIDVLKAAYGEGRLNKDEFDQRVTRITAARTYGDLGAVIADLPAGPLGGPSQYAVAYPPGLPVQVPVPETTNGLAVASFVCSLFGLFPPLAVTSVVMGHVARDQIRQRGQRGIGLATAGLVIGYLALAFWTLMIIIAVSHSGGPGPGPYGG